MLVLCFPIAAVKTAISLVHLVEAAHTIADIFYEALRLDLPEAFASKSGGVFRPISHQELHERVDRLALALRARGLKAGDRLEVVRLVGGG